MIKLNSCDRQSGVWFHGTRAPHPSQRANGKFA